MTARRLTDKTVGLHRVTMLLGPRRWRLERSAQRPATREAALGDEGHILGPLIKETAVMLSGTGGVDHVRAVRSGHSVRSESVLDGRFRSDAAT